jgi:RNA polymerase sigma-70 factor (ECF subfamily)
LSDAPPRLAQQPFAELFRAHAPFVWRVLRRHGVADSDLEDVCQEVFVVVCRRLAEFEGRARLRTWIYEIARRSALAHRRSRNARAHAPFETELADGRASPEAELEQARALRWLEAALARLSDEKREAFVLYELEEMTLAEVAEAQGCALNTVHYRVTTARAELRALAVRSPQPPGLRWAQGGP